MYLEKYFASLHTLIFIKVLDWLETKESQPNTCFHRFSCHIITVWSNSFKHLICERCHTDFILWPEVQATEIETNEKKDNKQCLLDTTTQ